MGITPQVHTLVQDSSQEVIMVLMEPQVMEGNMDLDQGLPPGGLMEVTVDSLMEGIMELMLLQVTSLLVLTQRHTNGSRVLTQTTVASSI